MPIKLTQLLEDNGRTPGEQAKQMGLDDLKFGRYGKNGQVTHIVDKSGKLVAKTGKAQNTKATGPDGNGDYADVAQSSQGKLARSPEDWAADTARYKSMVAPTTQPSAGGSASKSPDGKMSGNPVSQPPKGDYGNPEMGAMPKSQAPGVMDPVIGPNQDPKVQTRRGGAVRSWPSTEPNPSINTPDKSQQASDIVTAVKNREQLMKVALASKAEGNKAKAYKFAQAAQQATDRLTQMLSNGGASALDSGMQKYLVNRGLMPDPSNVPDEENPERTPRDASGASHFGSDQ